MSGNGDGGTEYQPGSIADLLINRLYIEDEDELAIRLLGALAAVLQATGDEGTRAFEDYCGRL